MTTTTEDKKPAPPRATRPAEPEIRETPARPKLEGMAVAFVRFDRSLQLPGYAATETVKTHAANRKSWTVTFIPALRHFRIEYVDGTKPAQVRYVHESRALGWDPPEVTA
jgi:hypothetical protein